MNETESIQPLIRFHVSQSIQKWLTEQSINEELISLIMFSGKIGFLILLNIVLLFAARKFGLPLWKKSIHALPEPWGSSLEGQKIETRLYRFVPIFIVYNFIYAFPSLKFFLPKACYALLWLNSIGLITSILDSLALAYRTKNPENRKPLRSFVQLTKLLLYFFGFLFVFGILLNQSPLTLLTGLGALTAVLMLVFKDTLLGLVASIQISANHLIQIGDWIEMSTYGADGSVIDISLHTVKVKNWDNTITTIPTYAMTSHSFKNWQGMSNSNGRRIKRQLNLDMNSVKFCDSDMIEHFSKIDLIKDYMSSKLTELKQQPENETFNQRQLTNLGTFRAYCVQYLKNHPQINQDLTLLVRHKEPGPEGIPLEIYVFSSNKEWVAFEDIQADIFDHLIAILPEFQLKPFQKPSGKDLEQLARGL